MTAFKCIKCFVLIIYYVLLCISVRGFLCFCISRASPHCVLLWYDHYVYEMVYQDVISVNYLYYSRFFICQIHSYTTTTHSAMYPERFSCNLTCKMCKWDVKVHNIICSESWFQSENCCVSLEHTLVHPTQSLLLI